MADDVVTLRLTRPEALVLFEWLNNIDAGSEDIPFGGPAEMKTIWAVIAMLESELPEPFRDDYKSIVEAARKQLSGDE